MALEPTCFVRGCWHPEELSAYVEFESRITAAIKKNNAENELIIVIPRFIYNQNPIRCKFRLFVVEVDSNGFDFSDRDAARSFFDTNGELIDYLVSNYPENKRKDNLIWDLQEELTIVKKGFDRDKAIRSLEFVVETQQKKINCLQTRVNQWKMIWNKDFSSINFPRKCAIYGCEEIGCVLCQKMMPYTQIIEFLDSHPRQKEYHCIPVLLPEDSQHQYSSDVPIIVVPSDQFEAITTELKRVLGEDVKTVRMESFLAEAKNIDLHIDYGF